MHTRPATYSPPVPCDRGGGSPVTVGILLWGQQSLPLLALVDSGVDKNFLDADLVTQVGIAVEPLAPSCQCKHKILAHVAHHTEPLHLLLSSKHFEHIQFNVISSPHSPVVQGLQWLKLHNSHIDWYC